MLETYDWYKEQLEEGDKKYPNSKDRFCSECGCRLIRGSVNWDSEIHLDGCE